MALKEIAKKEDVLLREADDFDDFTEKESPANDDLFLIEDSESSGEKKKVKFGSLPGAGGGEANTASSQGSGMSIVYQKSGVDLQFNAIKSENNRLSVALDGTSHDVELTVNEGNIDHDALANFVAEEHIRWDLTGSEDVHDDRIAQSSVTQHQAALSITESQISDLDHNDTDAIHDNVASEISALTEKGAPVSADLLIIEDSADSNNKKKVQVGNLPTGGGGEANTASSQGLGTSIYYQKSGVDLQFNAIKSENDRLSIALDGVSHDIELTLNEGNIDHDALTNFVAEEHIRWDLTGAEDVHDDRIAQSSVTQHQAALSITESQISDLGSYLENIVEDTTPQLGGDLDLNDKTVDFSGALASDHTGEGFKLPLTVSGLSFGQCVYINGNMTGALADADAVATMPAVGLYMAVNEVLVYGVARDDSWTWTANQKLYVGTDGNLTSTAPSGSGDQAQIVAIALNATHVLVIGFTGIVGIT